MTRMSLFGPPEGGADPKPPAADRPVRLRMLVTVKGAPNPSERDGETVCAAGLSVDPARPGWIRLYPINFRELTGHERFRKYDVISLNARPARQDQRRESWRPIADSVLREGHLEGWKPRRTWLDPYVETSMCRLDREVRVAPDAPSLGLVRPRDIDGLGIERHPGWTAEQQHRIDEYVGQLDLFGTDRTPLLAPRFTGSYRYRCHDRRCDGHRQRMLDWEFVAYQRRLSGVPDGEARRLLEDQFLGRMCAADRDVAFYVGNQAKRLHVFNVLGVYYPTR